MKLFSLYGCALPPRFKKHYDHLFVSYGTFLSGLYDLLTLKQYFKLYFVVDTLCTRFLDSVVSVLIYKLHC